MAHIVDIVNLWRTNRQITTLPSVEELGSLLEQPLANAEKVPISQSMFDFLLSVISDICSKHDIETLFTIGEEPLTLSYIFLAALYPPPSSGTERSFLPFWDDNIRKIIKLLMPSGTTIRNGDQDAMGTRNPRPDFEFLVGTACPFIGEEEGTEDEEGTENVTDPREELIDKLSWVYSPAPYILGQCLCSVVSSSELVS